MTLNCRKQTRLSGKKVYNVIDKHKHPVGIRIPSAVYASVLASSAATEKTRAAAVRRNDDRLEATYRDAVLASFPDIPRDRVARIVGHAMRKHSGRVGRTETLDAREKAVLGVLAHIRHVHSPYDKLLKEGVSRIEARRRVGEDVQRKAREWGFSRQVKGVSSGGGNAGKSRERPQAPQQKQQPAAKADTAKISAEAPQLTEKQKRKRAENERRERKRAARKRRRTGNARPSTITLPLRGKESGQPAPSSARPVYVTTRSTARTSRQDISQRSIPDHISISSDDEDEDDEGSGPDEDSAAERSGQDEFFWISSDDELVDKHGGYNEDDSEDYYYDDD